MFRSTNWHPMLAAPAPCDTCHQRALCAEEALACPAYVEYVRDGEPDIASTTPDRKNYEMVFSGKFLMEQDHGA